MPRLFRFFSSLTTLLALSACQPAATPPATASQSQAAAATAFLGSDIRADQIGGDFKLTDHNGRLSSLADSHGKVRVMVFGYTHCPDICPTNLFSYAEALKLLGEDARQVQLYFVSIDPERDTPALLKQYVPMFDPSFIGISPQTNAELTAIKQAYRVTATKVPRPDGDYFMDHSTGTYLLDQNGRATVYEPHGVPAKQIAHDLKLLIKSGTSAASQ